MHVNPLPKSNRIGPSTTIDQAWEVFFVFFLKKTVHPKKIIHSFLGPPSCPFPSSDVQFLYGEQDFALSSSFVRPRVDLVCSGGGGGFRKNGWMGPRADGRAVLRQEMRGEGGSGERTTFAGRRRDNIHQTSPILISI